MAALDRATASCTTVRGATIESAGPKRPVFSAPFPGPAARTVISAPVKGRIRPRAARQRNSGSIGGSCSVTAAVRSDPACPAFLGRRRLSKDAPETPP